MIVKAGSPSSDLGGSTPQSRWRHALQYLLVFGGVVLLVNALVGEKGLLETMKKRQEHSALEQALQGARIENARLREAARRLKEDATVIEDLARRELGLIRPGEKLFIITDVPSPADRP